MVGLCLITLRVIPLSPGQDCLIRVMDLCVSVRAVPSSDFKNRSSLKHTRCHHCIRRCQSKQGKTDTYSQRDIRFTNMGVKMHNEQILTPSNITGKIQRWKEERSRTVLKKNLELLVQLVYFFSGETFYFLLHYIYLTAVHSITQY